MEIRHASLLQVQKGRDGRKVLVENDVLDVVKQLQEISPDLHVNWNERSGHFSIVETCDDGKERLVTTVQELTPDIVDYVRMIGHESWDVVAEIDKMDTQAEKDKKHDFREKVGDVGERLHHALRRDLEVKDKLWVPGYAKDR